MSRGLISYRQLVGSCSKMALDGSIIVEICDETMAKMWRVYYPWTKQAIIHNLVPRALFPGFGGGAVSQRFEHPRVLGKAPWGRGCIIQVKFRAEKNLKACRIFTLPDPGLEIRRGSVIHTLRKGGRRSPKTFFSTLRASVWSRNKRGTRVPRAPPLDPQLI